MRISNFVKLALVALVMTLVSCKTQTSVQKTCTKTTPETTSTAKAEAISRVAANAQSSQYITSKIKFKVRFGDKDVSLGGKLYMKRDDVIRIQLTALGLFEAGRLELTKDYVLVMDRMNKQYIKVDYSKVDFLQQSGLNFYSLQSLFWNELFMPGRTTRVTAADMDGYTINLTQNNTLNLKLDKGDLHYNWTADNNKGLINHFNGSYADKANNNVAVDWAYGTFTSFGSKQFPTDNNIKVTTPKKSVSVELQLNSIDNDSDWETRTTVTSKYKQVAIDDILRKLSSL